VAVVEDGLSPFVFGEELLDFPVVLLGADAEFEIFFCDGVPVLRRVSLVWQMIEIETNSLPYRPS
jgi:hypothetical protein